MTYSIHEYFILTKHCRRSLKYPEQFLMGSKGLFCHSFTKTHLWKPNACGKKCRHSFVNWIVIYNPEDDSDRTNEEVILFGPKRLAHYPITLARINVLQMIVIILSEPPMLVHFQSFYHRHQDTVFQNVVAVVTLIHLNTTFTR